MLDYRPGGTGPAEDQAIIQSAMLEMIVPVIPHRLKDDWREVILKMDLLDLPGMRPAASRQRRRRHRAIETARRR